MRTPPLLAAALAAAAGTALLIAAAPASAQSTTTTPLSSCTGGWALNPNGFSCTVASTGGGITAPSGCSVSVNPPSASAATIVNVAVSCTGGSAPTSYSWTGGFMASQNASSGSGTLGQTTQFSVVASNSAGGSGTASGTFTFTGSTGGGGGGTIGGGISCANQGFAKTIVVPATWKPGMTSRALSSAYGGFDAGTAMVVKFTTGSKAGMTRITLAEYIDAQAGRTAVLSATPCDFGQQASFLATQTGISTTVNFSVGQNNAWGYPRVELGQTYYLNVKNEVDGVQTCFGSCNVFVDLRGL